MLLPRVRGCREGCSHPLVIGTSIPLTRAASESPPPSESMNSANGDSKIVRGEIEFRRDNARTFDRRCRRIPDACPAEHSASCLRVLRRQSTQRAPALLRGLALRNSARLNRFGQPFAVRQIAVPWAEHKAPSPRNCRGCSSGFVPAHLSAAPSRFLIAVRFASSCAQRRTAIHHPTAASRC